MVSGPEREPHRKGDPEQPKSGGGSSPIDFPREDFVALRNVLLNPKALPSEVSLCASNFCNTAIPALTRGTLSPDHALVYLSVKNPSTGKLLFQEQKLIEPLLCAISTAVHATVARDGPKGFISRDALDALCPYVASINGIEPETRLKVYQAIIAGSTKTVQCGGTRRDSDAVIDRIAYDLLERAKADPAEVAAIIRGIGTTPTHVLLANAVDSLIVQLSKPGHFELPALVQSAALEAMRHRAEIIGNRDEDGRVLGFLNKGKVTLQLQEALVNTMEPAVFRAAAENLTILLRDEVALLRASHDALATSDLTQDSMYRSWNYMIQAAISRAQVMFPSAQDAKEVNETLKESLSLAKKVEYGTTVLACVRMIDRVAPAFVSKRVTLLAHKIFTAAAAD